MSTDPQEDSPLRIVREVSATSESGAPAAARSSDGPPTHQVSRSTALARLAQAESSFPQLYRAPSPGRSWRSAMRFTVFLGGTAGIALGVAFGGLTITGAGLLAVGLATVQVFGQTWRQSKLGQEVVGGIANGELVRALEAAERAFEESPSGVMRTLAASNLASVLIQLDRVDDAARLLDEWRPSILHMPLSTILWLNNRAFAHLAGEDPPDAPRALLDDAERRMEKAAPRDLGGAHNARKLLSACAGTRAIERLASNDPRGALESLERARSYDDAMSTPFRTVERELCRAEALRLVGRKDEALLAVASLRETPQTGRQQARCLVLEDKLGLS